VLLGKLTVDADQRQTSTSALLTPRQSRISPKVIFCGRADMAQRHVA
jgi:hypothetical protein